MQRQASGIMLFNIENKFLVEHPTNHDPNFWSIPKGMIEKGEDPFDAAVRETFEETALDLNKINYKLIAELPVITFKTKKKSVKIYVLKTTDDLSDFPFHCESMVTYMNGGKLIKPFPEVDGFKWITIDEGYTMLHESQVRALYLIKKLMNI